MTALPGITVALFVPGDRPERFVKAASFRRGLRLKSLPTIWMSGARQALERASSALLPASRRPSAGSR